MKKSYNPLREIEVDYEIDNRKCEECVARPCLKSCPVNALHDMPHNHHIEIDENCIGCVLCRETCPYDAIKIKTTLSPPIREPVPNINPKLCLNCGACVLACKTGAIQLVASGTEEIHSEIDEERCVRCGYCARVCPSEAIKYGEILPRSVVGGQAAAVNQEKCIGCMTCTRVCPSKGAINVGDVSKLPYIDPAYCARCGECMDACPSTAIKYLPRDVAYEKFNKIKTMEIIYELLDRETRELSKDATRIDTILNEIAAEISSEHDEDHFVIDVTDRIKDELTEFFGENFEIGDVKDIIERIIPKREITVIDENCVGCAACIDQCPVDCIKLVMPAPIHIDKECVYCGKCVEVCPFDSISIKEEFFDEKDGKILFIRHELTGPRTGDITVDNVICQSCGVCINKCPVGALSFQTDAIVVDDEKCILCGECEFICPTHAIKLKTK